MNHVEVWSIDQSKILTRNELTAVLKDLTRRAQRSKSARMSLVLIRLACCCGLRVSEIAGHRGIQLQHHQGCLTVARKGHVGDVDPGVAEGLTNEAYYPRPIIVEDQDDAALRHQFHAVAIDGQNPWPAVFQNRTFNLVCLPARLDPDYD